MKKHYSLFVGLMVGAVFVLAFGVSAFADSTSQFNQYIQNIHVHRAQMENQLGLESTGDPFLDRGPSPVVQEPQQFTQNIQAIHEHRAQKEGQMGLDPSLDPFPQATSYYDDLVDHYEVAEMLRFDEIGRSI